jgi:ketosteroid isomerase-like protein
MKITTVRFGPDVWRMLENEAARAGVRVSQYIRDAALARAVAAATARGEEPFERLEQPHRENGNASPAPSAECPEALWLVRTGETNIEYVARLWEAFRAGGVDELARHVPDDVEWKPSGSDGRLLRGTRELRDFWSAREAELPEPTMFHGRGDDVLVRAEFPQRLAAQPLWLVYRFDGRRLVQAVVFETEAEAMAADPSSTAPRTRSSTSAAGHHTAKNTVSSRPWSRMSNW